MSQTSALFCVALTVFVSMATAVERHKVVIVGAGVSGYAAATTLLANNFTDFVVLEASDRIGGRIHTVDFGGVWIDEGAEFVHGERDNAVFELASPHNLLTSYSSYISNDKHMFFDSNGREYNSTVILELMDKAKEIMFNATYGSFADYFYPRFQEYLTANNIDPEVGEAVTHLAAVWEMSYSAADSLEQIGARGETEYVENEGDLRWKWKSRGYKTIFDLLARRIPEGSQELPVTERIQFGKEVTRVDHEGGEVTVQCGDGSSYKADHVIVTVSLGVLKARVGMFNPPLPKDKAQAIQTLGIGCVGKVILLFPHRWWPTDINAFSPLLSKKQLEDFKKNSTHGYWTYNCTGMRPVINNDRMLLAWYAGESCRVMEKLTEAEVAEAQMELLNTLLGKRFQIPQPEGILKSNWGSNPYTLGSYSFHTTESDRLNVTRHDLSYPILHGDKPVVMFAGEASHPHYYSTVHGGLSAGVREAKNLLKYLGVQTENA